MSFKQVANVSGHDRCGKAYIAQDIPKWPR